MVLDDCHPSKPVSVIEIHGTADGEVPYNGATPPAAPRRTRRRRWR